MRRCYDEFHNNSWNAQSNNNNHHWNNDCAIENGKRTKIKRNDVELILFFFFLLSCPIAFIPLSMIEYFSVCLLRLFLLIFCFFPILCVCIRRHRSMRFISPYPLALTSLSPFIQNARHLTKKHWYASDCNRAQVSMNFQSFNSTTTAVLLWAYVHKFIWLNE